MTAKKNTKTGKNFRGGGNFSGWPEYIPLWPIKATLYFLVSSLPTKDDKVQLQPSKETATRIPAEDLPAAATAVAAAIVPSRRNRSKSNPRLKTVPRGKKIPR